MRRIVAYKAMMAVILACLPMQAMAQESAKIVVQTQRELGAVNWRILGHNMEASDRRGLFFQPFDAPKIDPAGVMFGQGFWDPDKGAPVPTLLQLSKDIRMSVLRYPGGCLVHRYDWRQAVGPLSERPEWKFGIPEYLELCKQIGAEPIITISDYVLPTDEMPKHAADLVEYLNAPATTEHPWAMKREAWGHPEPYGVKWFEIGNESDHGNHKVLPRRQYTGEEYADYFLKTAAAMRAVDSNIKLGLVTVPGHHAQETWTRTVIARAGKQADFLVTHFYLPNGKPEKEEGESGQALLQSCMAAGEQAEYHMHEFRRLSQELCGRDLPLAMTEFNVGLGLTRKRGYDLASAIFLGDLLGVMMKPENNVLMANYWHLHQGVWGILRTRNGKTQAFAPYLMYKMWADHFGQTVVETQVQSPMAEFAGNGSIQPAKGTRLVESRSIGTLELNPKGLRTIKSGPIQGELKPDGSAVLVMDGLRDDQYPVLYRSNHLVNGGCDYRLTFEARVISQSAKVSQVRLGLAMQDSRGYTATGSGMVVRGLQSAREWQKFEGRFATSADSPGFEIIGHAVCGKLPAEEAISGRIEIRNLKVEMMSRESFPAYAELTARASVSQDKKKLYMVVFNKSLDRDIPVNVEIPDFSAVRAKRWEINAPSAASIEDVKETVSGADVPMDGKRLKVTFPAHSMTALELERP